MSTFSPKVPLGHPKLLQDTKTPPPPAFWGSEGCKKGHGGGSPTPNGEGCRGGPPCSATTTLCHLLPRPDTFSRPGTVLISSYFIFFLIFFT